MEQTNRSTQIENAMVVEEPKKKSFFKRLLKKKWFWIIGFVLLWILFAIRPMYHEQVLFLWKYKAWGLVAILLIWLSIWAVRKKRNPKKKLWVYLTRVILIPVLCIGFILSWFTEPVQDVYHELYMSYLYNHLDKEEITELPFTVNERIHARESIHAYAYSKTNDNLPVSIPHLIKDKFTDSTDNVWSMANLTVKKNLWQIDDDIKEVYFLPSHIANPKLPNHRYQVIFNTGDSMRFDKNAYVNAIKKLGFKFFNMDPDMVYYMHDDEGKIVQVISLVKWTGFLFPIPKFGGVIVVPSRDISAGEVITRNLFGYGKYYSPEECKKHDFLNGQNLFSESVTRLYAKSFSYRKGIYEAKFTKKDAIEIPTDSAIQNQYPFVSEYDWSHTKVKAPNGLYHYVPLEPTHAENTSLAISFFIRSDGSGKIYYYDHSKAKDGTGGVTSVLGPVKKLYPSYSWGEHFKIADVRTYFPNIPELEDKSKRTIGNYFFITSVVAINEQTGQVDAGTTPDLVAVNVSDNKVVKLDGENPNNWINQVREKYGFSLIVPPTKADTIRNQVIINDTIRTQIPTPIVTVPEKKDTVKKELVAPVVKPVEVPKDTIVKKKPVVKPKTRKKKKG